MHASRHSRPGVILLALVCLLAGGSCRREPDATLVAAAISLRHSLLDLGEAYEERNPHAAVRFHFAASGVLLQQALQGAPFDVILFAGEEEMDRLEDGGALAPSTRLAFASNRMVIAVPRGGAEPGSLEDLREPRYQRIALGSSATVPAGRYAAQALRNSGLWHDLEPRLVLTIDAGQAVEYVERNEVDAAFLYASDAVEYPWLTVALEVDPALHDPIRYTAAMLREPPDPDGATRFLELLEGNLAEVVLRRHGFRAERVAP